MRNTMTIRRPMRKGMFTLFAGLAVVGALAASAAAMGQDRTAPTTDRERTTETRERAEEQRDRAADSRERAERERERAQRERERAQQRRDRAERQRERRPGRMAEMPLRGQRVAIMVGEGLHDMETLAPLAYLVNRGARVLVIGIETGEVEAYNSDISVLVQQSVRDVRVNQFDALVLPGGRGPASLRENDDAVQFAKEFFESGKPVAAICHGPQVLVTAGVLEGRAATCIADIASELRESGAEYKDEPVVVDGNLITSRIPDDIPAFVKAIERMMVEHQPRGDRARERRPDRTRDRGRDRRGDDVRDRDRDRDRDRGRDGRSRGDGQGGRGGRGG